MNPLDNAVKAALRDFRLFAACASGLRLRSYQERVALAILDSVVRRLGLSFVVIFPRQSGKNELQAQIESYLLMIASHLDAEIVKVSPTWKPQSQNAMRRLERVLSRNLLTRSLWSKEAGYIYRLGRARIAFLSAAPTSNVVGATANLLLECDEAQDVLPAKWDRDIAPMAASTNATRVFWGTAWTADTLLARERRLAQQAERQDGLRRVFTLTADEVAAEVPAYGQFVAGQAARLGRWHPMVRTQFYSEEIEAHSPLFTPQRLALLRGTHPWQAGPLPGRTYAMLVDVAGGEEDAPSPVCNAAGYGGGAASRWAGSAQGGSPEAGGGSRRDATAMTIVEIGLETPSPACLQSAAEEEPPAGGDPRPVFGVVHRQVWTGLGLARQAARLQALAESWQPRWAVIDATGVGAGLASALRARLGPAVIPFIFSASAKSRLGWDFLALIESGRFKDHAPLEVQAGAPPQADQAEAARLQALFFRQLAHVQAHIAPGPEQRLSWSVPDGARGADGELLHDDLVISAALAAALDEPGHYPAFSRLAGGGVRLGDARSCAAPPRDPLDGLPEAY